MTLTAVLLILACVIWFFAVVMLGMAARRMAPRKRMPNSDRRRLVSVDTDKIKRECYAPRGSSKQHVLYASTDMGGLL